MKYVIGLSKHQLGWEFFTLEIGQGKKASRPLALTIHKWQFLKWTKIHSLGLFLYFINIIILSRLKIHPQNKSNSNLGVWSWIAMCPPFHSLPSSPNLSGNPLSFPKSHERSIGCYNFTWNFRYVIFNNSYLICFISFIASSSLFS